MSKQFSPQEIGEIQADFRRNGDLKDAERLKRVAELHGCKPAEIAEVLHLADREAKAELTRGIRGKHIKKRIDPDTRKAAIKDALLEGMTQAAVAEKYGVSATTVCGWVSEARKTQQEFLDYPEPAENPTNAAGNAPQNAPTASDAVPSLPQIFGAFAGTAESGKPAVTCNIDAAQIESGTKKLPSASMETLATRANQICSAVEGAQCLWDEADRYGVLPQSDLDDLASMIERMQHFQLGFETGLAAAAAEAAR